MTVRELIEKLKKLPEDAVVVVPDWKGDPDDIYEADLEKWWENGREMVFIR